MTRRFIIGFAIGLVVCIAINLLSAHLALDCGLLAVLDGIPVPTTLHARAGRLASTRKAVSPIVVNSI